MKSSGYMYTDETEGNHYPLQSGVQSGEVPPERNMGGEGCRYQECAPSQRIRRPPVYLKDYITLCMV